METNNGKRPCGCNRLGRHRKSCELHTPIQPRQEAARIPESLLELEIRLNNQADMHERLAKNARAMAQFISLFRRNNDHARNTANA